MTTDGSPTRTTQFGPYELGAVLGTTGNSTLHRARDRFRARDVAVRIWSPGSTAGDGPRCWKALQQIADPRIVRIHASGEIGGRLFLDTELASGPTLAALLSLGPLPKERAWALLEDVAGALDAAAEAGVTHNDLNARSVLVEASGARVADFGLRAPDGDSRGRDLSALARLVAAATGVPAPRVPTRESGAPEPSAIDLVREARAARTPPAAPAWLPPAGPPPSPGRSVIPGPRAGGTDPSWWGRHQTRRHTTTAPTITVGRDPSSDVVLGDLLVAPRHAELRRDSGAWRIRDLGSSSGTFVNGRRVNRADVVEYDVIGIGRTLLRFVGGRLIEYADTGDITFVASDLRVEVGGKALLDGVGFELGERCLLAVIGPSGAGKSTLLGALTGTRPATTGTVAYAGRDLYENYDELRQRIGLVPQDDVLHVQLPVRQALRYAARLRFPAETTVAEQYGRVEEVLHRLALDGPVADQRITTLSGGQRKRVSVALELLTRPSLLFLDEPTSGLDPGMRKDVMQTLRELADEGRTVVTVTHDENSLEVCDHILVLAKGGRLAFFGPPGEALAYFGQTDFADVFRLLNRDDGTDWSARFLASPHAALHLPRAGASVRRAVRPAPPPPAAQPPSVQLAILCRRYLSVVLADRWSTGMLLVLPVVLGLVTHFFPGGIGLSVDEALARPVDQFVPLRILLVMVVAGAFAGFASSFRELVKERAIYQRERAIGLSRWAYLGSKLVVLGIINVAQAAGIGLIGMADMPVPDDGLVLGSARAEVTLALVAVALAMMALGLLVSALIANSDRGMPLLVVILMAALVLSGGIFTIEGLGVNLLSWFVPARWGLAMTAATVDMERIKAAGDDRLWSHDPGTWALSLTVLLVFAAVAVAGAAIALRRLEPQRRTAGRIS